MSILVEFEDGLVILSDGSIWDMGEDPPAEYDPDEDWNYLPGRETGVSRMQ